MGFQDNNIKQQMRRMGIDVKDETPEEAQMKLGSAKGNKPVESKRGGTDDVVTTLSLNEQNRLPITRQSETVTRTTYDPKWKDFEEFYRPQAFDTGKAEEAADNYVKGILARARETENVYGNKADRNTRNAKIAAWANFLGALGQLAGAGKNTYVKPDDTYLKKALADADNAREVYDRLKLANRQKADEAKASYIQMLRAENQKMNDNLFKGALESMKGYNTLQSNIMKSNTIKTENVRSNDDYYKGRNLEVKEGALAERKRHNLANEGIARGKSSGSSLKGYEVQFDDAEGRNTYHLTKSQVDAVIPIIIEKARARGMEDTKIDLLKATIAGSMGPTNQRSTNTIASRELAKLVREGDPDIMKLLVQYHKVPIPQGGDMFEDDETEIDETEDFFK